MTQIIKNAKLINGNRCNILIKEGKIIELTDEQYQGWDGKVITLPDDVYVSSGWIDLHTHAFPKYKPYCAQPDDIGYLTGVTTVVDAGSSGADDFAEFYEGAKRCKTNVFSFLNVSRIGLQVHDELADLSNLSSEAIEAVINQYPETIVGLKVRMSGSVIGKNGIQPLLLAKKIANEFQLPLMVHIGSAPPKLVDILTHLDKGDIVTHCFNEKKNNHIYANQANMNAVKAAIKRGVNFDVGHGTSSFSFNIARRAKHDEIPFHSISTDIYQRNQVNGPVYNLATTLTKFLALGYNLEEVIHSVTKYPAKMMNKQQYGEINVGTDANLTFFKLKQSDLLLTDSFGNEIISPWQIVPSAVFIGGNYYDL